MNVYMQMRGFTVMSGLTQVCTSQYLYLAMTRDLGPWILETRYMLTLLPHAVRLEPSTRLLLQHSPVQSLQAGV